MSTTNEEQQMLDLLTPEEREAMQDAEYSPEELAAMKGIIEDDDGSQDDEGDDDDNEPAAAESVAPVEKKVETVAEEPAAEEDPPAAEFKPRYKADLPADFADQVSTLNNDMAELANQLRSGDIEFDEYNAKQSELLAKRDELNAIKLKADIASDMGAQTVEQEWAFTVDRFVKATAKDEGINYATDAAKQADLDMFVKAIASVEANANKPMEWFLQEAHKRVKALHGVEQKQEEDPKPKQKRNTPVATIPKTLAQVPGGDGPGDVADEFANLDGLEGVQLEDAIARMTPAQRERYAQAA